MITMLKDAMQGKAPLGKKRSPQWPGVRATHLKSNPTCAVCKGTDKLEVHHKQPFHLHPELELDPTNLITLCESKKHGLNCHLFIGHGGNYKEINEYVQRDADSLRARFFSKEEKGPSAA